MARNVILWLVARRRRDSMQTEFPEQLVGQVAVDEQQVLGVAPG